MRLLLPLAVPSVRPFWLRRPSLAAGWLLASVGHLFAQSPPPAASPSTMEAAPPAPVPVPAAEGSPAPAPTATGETPDFGPAVNRGLAAPAPKTMEASFDFEQGVILLDVNLSNRQTVKLAFDTGDEANVLDLELAKELKIPFDQMPQIAPGKGPDISVPQIQVKSVRVGDADFPDRDFLILPIAGDLKKMGITCQGTLGYRFFEEKVVQIDYPARKLRMLEEMPAAPEGAVLMPIRWMPYDKQGVVGVTTVDDLKLDDHAMTAQFDTLFARTMILFTSKLPWLETTRVLDMPNAYYAHAGLRAALPNMKLSLGSHVFAHAPPAYLADKDAHIPEGDISTVLGNVFFLDAVVTLDYKHDKMLVEWKKS